MIDSVVNPKILTWSRLKMGWDIDKAAKKIGVKPEKLEQVEEGKTVLTFNQLLKLSKAYKRSIATFLMDEPPVDINLPDFRGTKSKIPAKLEVIIRELYERKKNLAGIFKSIKTNRYEFVGSINIEDTSIEQAIERTVLKVEEVLSIDHTKLIKLRDNAALNYIRELIENNDILTVQFKGIPLEVTRGFSFSETPLPLIALNKEDSYYGRNFTLIHELTHLLLNKSGVCIGDSKLTEESPVSIPKIERICNKTASLFLLPNDELRNYLAEIGWDDSRMNLTEKELQTIFHKVSNRFKVSYSVVNYTFRDLKLFYKQRDSFPTPPIRPKKKGGGNYYSTYLSDFGRRSVKLLFEAKQKEFISDVELYRVSGLSLKGLEHFEKMWENGEL